MKKIKKEKGKKIERKGGKERKKGRKLYLLIDLVIENFAPKSI